MDLHLKIIGVLLIALAFVHVIFPKYFNWEKELHLLSLVNRQMIWIHTFFIAFTVLLMGVLCLTSSYDLITQALAKKYAGGLGSFGEYDYLSVLRLFFKVVEGQGFETVVHILFTSCGCI